MLIGAGADTTSSVLQSFFKVMALHPEFIQKAHEGIIYASERSSRFSTLLTSKIELDRVVGPDRLPTWEDESSLPYIRSLIKEVHRWGPIGSLGEFVDRDPIQFCSMQPSVILNHSTCRNSSRHHPRRLL